MRRLLICAALALGGLMPATTAKAYEGPWCLKANMGRSVSEICHFRTFEACRDDRGHWGSTAFCTQNPRYLPYWQGRGFEQEPRRKLSRKKKHRRG
jgi:hypothetical protein